MRDPRVRTVGAEAGSVLVRSAHQRVACALRVEISIVIVIEGDVAPGFERVRDVFGDNFESNGDVGAAVCVYRHGRKVVDLWGGLADAGTGLPWTRDTLQLVYSATKAATATCAHLLAQRGELDLDKPAAHYWPEFAAAGKADIPVRWLLSHRAGLPVIDNPMPLADLLAWDPMAAALSRPAAGLGARHRARVPRPDVRLAGGRGDQAGVRPQRGDVLRRGDRGAKPGSTSTSGCPRPNAGQVSRMIIDDPPGAEVAAIPIEQIPEQFRGLVAAFTDPESLMNRAFALQHAGHRLQLPRGAGRGDPSSNGICTADGLARLYAALIGEVDGVRILDAASLAWRDRRSRPPDLTGYCWYPPVSRRDTCSRRRRPRSAARPRSAIRAAAGRSVSATRRAASRSATWSATSGRTWPTTARAARPGRAGHCSGAGPGDPAAQTRETWSGGARRTPGRARIVLTGRQR
mgnify:CR=1 FL=1